MIKWIKKLLGIREGWMPWEGYKARIDFLDMFHFQQSTRKQNVKNMEGF